MAHDGDDKDSSRTSDPPAPEATSAPVAPAPIASADATAPAEQEPELYCVRCGYNLRGITSDRCPECGVTVDWEKLAESRIPWTHRARLGRVRAFLRTVWLVTARPAELAKAAVLPVSYHDAVRFRWIVVAIVALPLIAAALAIRAYTGDVIGPAPGFHVLASGAPVDFLVQWDLHICVYVGWLSWPVPSIAILLLLAGITGVHSYFFAPRAIPLERQNRALALSQYCSAPLVGMIVPMLLLSLSFVQGGLPRRWQNDLFGLFTMIRFGAIGGACLTPFLLWMNTLRVLHGTTGCSAWRVIAAAVSIPAMWVLVAILTLVVFPGVWGFFKLVLYSFMA